MKPFTSHKTALIKKLGCKPERMEQGYDMICEKEYYSEKYLVRAINKNCNINISHKTFLEARKHRPRLIIYDPATLTPIAKLDYSEWVGILYGYVERRIYYLPRKCYIRFSLTSGLSSKKVCIVLSKEKYEKLQKKLEEIGDWEKLFDLLL
jgi:hypothetical protein